MLAQPSPMISPDEILSEVSLAELSCFEIQCWPLGERFAAQRSKSWSPQLHGSDHLMRS